MAISHCASSVAVPEIPGHVSFSGLLGSGRWEPLVPKDGDVVIRGTVIPKVFVERKDFWKWEQTVNFVQYIAFKLQLTYTTGAELNEAVTKLNSTLLSQKRGNVKTGPYGRKPLYDLKIAPRPNGTDTVYVEMPQHIRHDIQLADDTEQYPHISVKTMSKARVSFVLEAIMDSFSRDQDPRLAFSEGTTAADVVNAGVLAGTPAPSTCLCSNEEERRVIAHVYTTYQEYHMCSTMKTSAASGTRVCQLQDEGAIEDYE